MNRNLVRTLIRLYPRAWRERYGEEFEALLLDCHQDSPGRLKLIFNVARAAAHERFNPTQGATMSRDPNSFAAIVRYPSAYLPMAMSLAALALVVGPIPFDGIPVREADEGTIAHLFQILMAGQLPFLAYFAVKWLRRAPRQALSVLALQAGAVLAALAPVFYFNL